MFEIGRLREITFREVNEGTGRALDLDNFDNYYLHLFLWSKTNEEIVGAYRLGLTNSILERFGIKGLYTNTLFKYETEFLNFIENFLELGRSFIRPEYQRKYNCLSLLWQGIATFVAHNPQYYKLFGPVSISQNYNRISKDLIVQFLKENKIDPKVSRLVKARNPHRNNKIRGINKQILQNVLSDIDDVSLLISEIEKDGKGVPILLKHYLKLNASLLSFNIDKKFSDVIDGLVVVDLLRTDPKILKRFMKEEGYLSFLKYRQNENFQIH